MIQMILDVGGQALALPESRNGGYTVDEQPLMQDIEMISGRTTREYRGVVWVASHQYGYLNDADKNRFLAAVKAGLRGSILCSILPQDGGELVTSRFIVTEYRRPKFMWSNEGKPLWGDYYVAIREVSPHA